MSRYPEVKWAQRSDKVYLTILLADAKHVQINLEPDGVFTFSGIAGSENILYELKLELYDKVNVETSKLNTGVRSIFCVINKAENGWWKKLLRGDGKLPHYIKVDWDKWVDADDGPNGDEFEGMDLSKLGNMGDMDGVDDFDDGDAEDAGEFGDYEKTDKAASATKIETEAAPST
ncbi:hypothetical protein KFK09_022401 [Dendrobium nobile]|uniref:Co-chaperone protein p23 n=1 Tax=Dendrobium nobile TaxID=94219 RepID=A0A8T3AJD4_DENNO|nr:hypothetical protein KFK09_022401 [Dendrobium nobile]